MNISDQGVVQSRMALDVSMRGGRRTWVGGGSRGVLWYEC